VREMNSIMETASTDVLVRGAGAAGVRAALAASEAGANVLMVSKGELTQSGSTFSNVSRGWGIQAIVGTERTEENLERFYDEIVSVGLGICDPILVRIVVEESGPRLEDLLSYGIQFRKDSQGNLLCAKGCFSEYERAFVADDIRNIRSSFLSEIRRSSVKIVTGYAVELLREGNACWGAWIVGNANEIVRINAKSTVLATGGGAGIFKDHLVSEMETGDGYALAFWAGAELRNLEFIQFMLGLKRDGYRRFLPLAALSKPHILCDSEGRDLLDLHIPNAHTRERAVRERQRHFPFSSRDSSWTVDIAVAKTGKNGEKVFWRQDGAFEDQSEVVHFSHAFNGGIKIDEKGESSVVGLFGAGEVAAGPHGADRIGGCMMTATQVFGMRAGRFAALRAKKIKTLPEIKETPEIFYGRKRSKDNMVILKSVIDSGKAIYKGSLMILRHERGLLHCLESIKNLECELNKAWWGNRSELIKYVEAKVILEVGKLVARSALRRRSSLGGHFRIDSHHEPENCLDYSTPRPQEFQSYGTHQ
jgi:fumarate reductase (CoM/CoB) subunit A